MCCIRWLIRQKLNGKCGLDSWQWIFLIEGAFTVALAPIIYLLLLTFPETSTALTDRRRFLSQLLERWWADEFQNDILPSKGSRSARAERRTRRGTPPLSHPCFSARLPGSSFSRTTVCVSLEHQWGRLHPLSCTRSDSQPPPCQLCSPHTVHWLLHSQVQRLPRHHLLLHHTPLLSLATAFGLDARADLALRLARVLCAPLLCYLDVGLGPPVN